MITHKVKQGTDQWLSLRAQHDTASEAPVMMAASSKMKRDEMLSNKAGFSEREYSEWVQKNLFDKGHAAEAKARPIVEAILGETLYPVTGSEGGLLASFDGLTLMEDVVFEHKMWNESLAEAVRKKDLPAEYYWQLEQLLLVSGAEKAIFVVSDGTEDNMVWMWYHPVPGRADELRRGWDQFHEDLKGFAPTIIPAAPEPEVIETLPALVVQMRGEVTESNLAEYKTRALSFISRINTDLLTDQDFANAEATVKFCKSAEDKIDVVKAQALAQTQSIEQMFAAMDEIKETLRRTRLDLDKKVKSEKESRRAEIIKAAQVEAAGAEREAEAEFGGKIPFRFEADFASAIKGKRNLSSIHSAVNDELAAGKIKLTAARDHVRKNLQMIESAGEKYRMLFSDIKVLAFADSEHLALLIESRINEFEAKIAADAEKAELKAKMEAQAATEKAEQEPRAEPVKNAAPSSVAATNIEQMRATLKGGANRPVVADEEREAHFKQFWQHVDFESVFTVDDFNTDADPAIVGQKLIDLYQRDFEAMTGRDWSDVC